MSTPSGRYLEVVHTPLFEASAKGVLTPEQIRAIETELAKRPDAGVIIPETGGVRKVRFALPGQGKSGGARVIYYAHLPCEKVYLILVYAKNERENLTSDQKRLARRLVKALQDEGC